MKITKELIRKVVTESLKRTVLKEFELEGDFQEGAQVWWYPTERVVKIRPSSGKEYIDYERVEKTGKIVTPHTASGTAGAATVRDEEGNTQEIPLADLNLAPLESAMVTA